MPNHCENDLIVSGSIAEVKRFVKFAKGKNGADGKILEMENFIPYPAEYKKADEAARKAQEKADKGLITREEAYKVKDGYNNGGYDWCTKNRGTKWGFYDILLEHADNVAIYHFNTAWSPALPVIAVMGEMFPNLKIHLEYFEGGGGFQGVFSVEKGKVVTDRCDKYNGERGG